MIWMLAACIPSFPDPADGAPVTETGCDPAPEICGDALDQDCDGTPQDCVLAGQVALADRYGTAGLGQHGAVLARAGNAFTGSAGAAIGIGSSTTLDGSAFHGDQAWLMAVEPSGNLAVHTLTFPSPLAGQHSRLVGLGDLDGDGVDELMAASACYDGELGFGDCGEVDPDGSTAIVLTGGVSGDVDLASPPSGAVPVDGPAGSCPGVASVGLGDGRWATAGGCADSDVGTVWVLEGLPPGPLALASDAAATLTGDLSSHYALGWSLAGADLVGADGVSDLVAGSFGSGGTPMSALVFDGDGLTGALTIASASASWTSDRSPGPHNIGTRLESAGDVDGDGAEDLLIGLTSNTSAGRVYLIRGGAVGSGSVDAVAHWTLEAGGASTFGGAISAGDLDGDGVPDLLAGAPEADGAAWLIPGSELGGTGTLDAVDLASATWVGDAGQGDRLGISLLVPGDADGDGWGDVVVGFERHPTAAAMLFAGGVP